MATQLLSLEDRCLLHLVCHLEEYPPETLASLPLRLRRRLLLSLPAVDICQLEGTVVTQGVDMEASTWRQVQEQLPKVIQSSSGFEHYKNIYLDRIIGQVVDLRGQPPKPLPKVNQSGFRESLFDQILHSVFLGDTSTAGDCLFAVHGPLRDHVFPPAPPYSVGTPPRHIIASTEDSFAVHVFSALVNLCKCLPEDVTFNCEQLGQTDLWKRRNMALLAMIGNLLSETKSLTFFGDGNAECLSIPRNIFEVIFSRSKPVLTSLSLNGHLDFILGVVADAELFFAPACNHELQFLYPQPLSCSLPYGGLTSLNVEGVGELNPEVEGEICNKLNSIVLHQKALESVSMCSFPPSPNIAFKLYRTLGCLFYQPQFRVLSLEEGDLDWNDLNVLVRPFLTSSISPSHQQELKFGWVSLKLNGQPPSVETMVSSSTRKALTFAETIFEDEICSDSPRSFLNWLSDLNVPSMLSSFEFSIQSPRDEPQEALGSPMSLLKDETSAALLESFSIGWAPLFLDPSPHPFIYLFSSARLKRVCLMGTAFNDDLPMLTQGLQRQVPHGALEELNLERNDLGFSSDEDFQEFSDAIFLLPHLKKLKLTLTRNKLKARHFTMLYGAWRRSNAGRMDTLNVKGNAYEDYTSILHGIAVSGDFVSI